MEKKKVIVVGGGASGMTAAIAAARNGAFVVLFEQKDRVGKKILATGNGRCNFTNEWMKPECYFGEDTSIVSHVLDHFGYEETISFFKELGVLPKSRQGYLYPMSDQASTILDVLRMEMRRLSVEIHADEKVTQVEKTKKGFQVKTLKSSYTSDAVILSTGGKASPSLGSDGSGYELAKKMGHSISPVVPALAALIGEGNFWKQVAGVRTYAKVSLYSGETLLAEDTGELQLTNYGISGIPVFQVSRHAGKALYEKKAVRAVIDFLPNLSRKEVFRYLEERRDTLGYKTAEEFLVGMFHKKLIGLFLKTASISIQQKAKEISEKQLKMLTDVLKSFSVEIQGIHSFEQAQVCAGGVRTNEVDTATLESVYVKNLYLTGELLDIDGICGGYNLQWAFATGYIAGENAGKGR